MAINYPQSYDDDFLNIIKRIIDELNSIGYTYEEALQKADEILDEAQSKSNDILDEAKRVNALNENVQQQINTLIAESGTSDAEVLQARIDAEGNEYPVLKDRLDESDAQLAQTDTKQLMTERQTLSPLFINTFDGKMDALHPSVVHLDTPLNGYNYYMVYTPLSWELPYTDRWECPSISASKDGVNWETPTGLVNPIDDLTQEQINNRAYFSDPTIAYNENEQKLEVIYRFSPNETDTQNSILYRKTSLDGVNWSPKEVVYDPLTSTSAIYQGGNLVSPQLIHYPSTDLYRLYYQTDINGVRTICYVESMNPVNDTWTNYTECNLLNTISGSNLPWHFGLFFDKTDNTYHMLGYESFDGGEHLVYYKSNDGISFECQGVSVSTKDQFGLSLERLYQSYPLKVDGVWKVYVTGLTRVGFRGELAIRWMQVLFAGKDLLNLSPINGGTKLNREVHLNDVVLGNSDKINGAKDLTYVVHESEDRRRKYGYSIDMSSKAPVWYTGTTPRTIPIVLFDKSVPLVKPNYRGQLWHRTGTKEFWLAMDNKSQNDWAKFVFYDENNYLNGQLSSINNNGSVVQKNQKLYAFAESIDVTNIYKVFINSGTGGNLTNFVSNGIQGQEIVVVNELSTSITLKHIGNTTQGFIRLRGQTDRVLKQHETIRLLYRGNYWLEC